MGGWVPCGLGGLPSAGDLENAASPKEADELEVMTADEMAVDGYYVVAGIARHEYKQGWKFLTLWDGYGLSEAT